MFSINDYIQNNTTLDPDVTRLIRRSNAPRIFCTDGFNMSVQASMGHYCSPRTCDTDVYTAFEIGFPSEPEELILEYAESPEFPTETVYSQVPAEIIEQIVEKHGGIRIKKLEN